MKEAWIGQFQSMLFQKNFMPHSIFHHTNLITGSLLCIAIKTMTHFLGLLAYTRKCFTSSGEKRKKLICPELLCTASIKVRPKKFS